ncbi:hypothetical protein [Streptomyces panaciradicis]|uniref:hypothetical protein n=1 Tax=Streptomyces panaciradicis TaxID=1470261 RepID=UPI00201CD5FB|nr:hypothetical protein [Streptomyces panaciradicis]MCL6670896.1 hypothetical protein [Streptomyces panaciradicis]
MAALRLRIQPGLCPAIVDRLAFGGTISKTGTSSFPPTGHSTTKSSASKSPNPAQSRACN